MASNQSPEDNLSRLFRDATAGADLDSLTHKPASATRLSNSSAANSTGSNAWANNKASSPQALMGNGKDFFAELRRQVASLVDKERAGG